LVSLFAFQIIYVKVHLFTEAHYANAAVTNSTSSGHAHTHEHHHDGEGHDHDSHQPHSASDHELQLAAKRQISLFAVDVLLPETSILLPLSEPQLICFVRESGSPPGESPPDPLQPRAPPVV